MPVPYSRIGVMAKASDPTHCEEVHTFVTLVVLPTLEEALHEHITQLSLCSQMDSPYEHYLSHLARRL